MDAVLETFIDRFGEVSFKEGMIRIELVSLSGAEPRVTQRLIMSVHAFVQTLPVQHQMLERLQRAGVIRTAPSAQPEATPEPTPESTDRPPTEPEPVPRPQAPVAPPKSPNFANR